MRTTEKKQKKNGYTSLGLKTKTKQIKGEKMRNKKTVLESRINTRRSNCTHIHTQDGGSSIKN